MEKAGHSVAFQSSPEPSFSGMSKLPRLISSDSRVRSDTGLVMYLDSQEERMMVMMTTAEMKPRKATRSLPTRESMCRLFSPTWTVPMR